MSIEYLPSGVKCNLKCSYCYQEPMREAGNFSSHVDFVRVKETLSKQGDSFTVFGGEPLLTPLYRLEEIFQFGFDKYGKNGIQTNGLLITDKHIDIFRKYNVHVGLSLDGKGKLNSPRCCTDDTDKIVRNIENLFSNHIDWSIITTIHRLNGSQIDDLIDFLKSMESLGALSVNLHNLEIDFRADGITLTKEENLEIFFRLYQHSKESNIPYHPFTDIRDKLTGRDAHCVWNNCDPITTPAVQGISADGYLSNCGRVNKDGVNWLKPEGHGSERYLALWNIPLEYGGCKDCNYFFVCGGQCPGTAIDGDWRNKTRDCWFWYELIRLIERDLSLISNYSDKNLALVERMSNPSTNDSHGDVPHGDGHGDEHGDHTDRTYKSQGVSVVWRD